MEDEQQHRLARRPRKSKRTRLTQEILDQRDELQERIGSENGHILSDQKAILEELNSEETGEFSDR